MYLFQYYFLQVIEYILYIYHLYFPVKVVTVEPTILNKTDEYIKEKTEQFKNRNRGNSNIEPVFYKKDEFMAMIRDSNNTIEESWKTRILFEKTPRGNIVMYYDAYKHGFAYCCDTNSIPYSVLNAVAMKYVYTYFCRDFFIDNEGIAKENESPLIQLYHREPTKQKEETSKNSIDNTGGPFAKLKNYNKPVRNTDKNQAKKKEKEVEYIRNKFIYLGKMVNYSFIKKEKRKLPLNGFKSNLLDGIVSESQLQQKVLNYKDFKKSMQKKNLSAD